MNSNVFAKLRSLCVCIGSVIPILPSVCDLFTRYRKKPQWHVSLINDQKENEPEKALFVSAIDPRVYKRFMTSGDNPKPVQGMLISVLFIATTLFFALIRILIACHHA